jgi:putative FmdB family regulatory protein
MPIYEYRCPNNHVFELFQRMTDPMPEGCEVCGASPVERVLYPVAVHFKGSGFYSTDYKNGASKTEVAKNGGSEEKPAASEKKSEKSAASSEKASSKQD